MIVTVMVLCVTAGAFRAAATLSGENGESAPTAQSKKLSETDAYLDLNTGNTFHFIYDGLNDVYNRDDLFAAEFYVNTRTADTFWMDDAIVVNNALLRDAQGKYRIDPSKVKRQGNTFRTIKPQTAKP